MNEIQLELRDCDSTETTPFLAVNIQMAWGAEQRKGFRQGVSLIIIPIFPAGGNVGGDAGYGH